MGNDTKNERESTSFAVYFIILFALFFCFFSKNSGINFGRTLVEPKVVKAEIK